MRLEASMGYTSDNPAPAQHLKKVYEREMPYIPDPPPVPLPRPKPKVESYVTSEGRVFSTSSDSVVKHPVPPKKKAFPSVDFTSDIFNSGIKRHPGITCCACGHESLWFNTSYPGVQCCAVCDTIRLGCLLDDQVIPWFGLELIDSI